MVPGGKDERIRHGRRPSEVADFLIRVCRNWWPTGMVEFVGGVGGPYSLRSLDVLKQPQSHEFFVYHSPSAAEAWNKLGATPETSGSMLHFLVEDDGFTVVHDDCGSSQNLMALLRVSFRDPLWH